MKTINVSVAILKAKLSEYLRMVRQGSQIVVLDHKHPIAKVGPINKVESDDFVSIRPVGNPSFRGIFPSPKTSGRSFSSLDILLEDRKKR